MTPPASSPHDATLGVRWRIEQRVAAVVQSAHQGVTANRFVAGFELDILVDPAEELVDAPVMMHASMHTCYLNKYR